MTEHKWVEAKVKRNMQNTKVKAPFTANFTPEFFILVDGYGCVKCGFLSLERSESDCSEEPSTSSFFGEVS